jgi:hypothetical protein
MAVPLLNGEDGSWRRFFPTEPPRHSFEKRGASARAHFFDHRFYIEGVLKLLRAGDVQGACRFLGVFSHYLGDFAEPAHYCEREITLLVPPPPGRLNCNSHRMIEDISSRITEHSYRPRPLGDTAGTLILRLEGRLRQLYERAMATPVPMLQALYADDTAAASRLSDRVVAETVEVMGDVFHSLWCIHRDGWTGEERDKLSRCRLDMLEPVAYDVEFNYGCRPIRGAISVDQIGSAVPLRLNIATDDATTMLKVEGLCVVPHALPIEGTQYRATLDFDLPPGAFERFTCTAGLLADFPPQATCRFLVRGDDHLIHESPPLTSGDPAEPINVDISGTRRLRLAVYTDGSTDKLAFPIWAWPTVTNGTAVQAEREGKR